MRSVNNKSGFTILEITITFALIMVVGLGVMQLMKMVNDKQTYIKNKTDTQKIEQSLILITSVSENCSCQFSHIKFPLDSIPKRIDLAKLYYSCDPVRALPFVTTDKNLADKGFILVDDIYLTRIRSTGNVTEFVADLNVKPKFQNKSTEIQNAKTEIKLFMDFHKKSKNVVKVVGCGNEIPVCKLPWGKEIKHGEKVKAYRFESADDCEKSVEERTCLFGSLSGTYTHQKCFSTDCVTPWGERINTEKTIDVFRSEIAPNCDSELIRVVCKNSAFSPLQQFFKECRDPKCYAPWGEEMVHGSTIVAFQASRAEDCSNLSQVRQCFDGKLSGEYTSQFCKNTVCKTPWGTKISDGSSVDAYDSEVAQFCEDANKPLVCRGGVLSDGGKFPKCESIGCKTPWGEKINNGELFKAYLSEKSRDCDAKDAFEYRKCELGRLSGSYQFAKCSVPDCITPWGERIAQGNNVVAYLSAQSSDCQANSEVRKCDLGVLSGYNKFKTCTPLSCTTPWGEVLFHEQSVTAFESMSSENCLSQQRICKNGVLSGSYFFKTCEKKVTK